MVAIVGGVVVVVQVRSAFVAATHFLTAVWQLFVGRPASGTGMNAQHEWCGLWSVLACLVGSLE